MTQIKNEYSEFRLWVLHETERAILVSETLSREDSFWLPRSQISYEETGKKQGAKVFEIDVRIPDWLSIEKGLV